MNAALPRLFLVRHGETAWSASGQHTGRSDIPLTPAGEQNAIRVGRRLYGQTFARVLTSPLQRARRTCELAGFGDVASVNSDLVEWSYGDYEGKTTAEIHKANPNWNLFRDGAPAGESVEQIGARADHVLSALRQSAGDTLLFSSGHFLRVLTARWLNLPPASGELFILGTASLSILGYEHDRGEPVIQLWNDRSHLTV